MSSDPRTILITEDGFESVRSLFNRARVAKPAERNSILNDARRKIFDPKTDFENFYKGLYAAALINSDDRIELLPPDNLLTHFSGTRAAWKLELISDIHIGHPNFELEFESSLPNEFDVADIYNLRSEVMSAIQLPTKLAAIEFGCIYLSFNIYASKDARRGGEGFTINSKVIERSDYWNSLFERYKIKTNHITPI